MLPRSAVVFFLLAAIAVVSATNVSQCKGRSFENLSSNVQLNPCKKPPCKLKKGTSQQISIAFTPETEIDELTNNVKAKIFNVLVPFLGVDGISVCDKIYNEAGEKSPCPLQAGTTYFYKDSFPILQLYPTLSNIDVHWSLNNKDQELACFKVRANIIA